MKRNKKTEREKKKENRDGQRRGTQRRRGEWTETETQTDKFSDRET